MSAHESLAWSEIYDRFDRADDVSRLGFLASAAEEIVMRVTVAHRIRSLRERLQGSRVIRKSIKDYGPATLALEMAEAALIRNVIEAVYDRRPTFAGEALTIHPARLLHDVLEARWPPSLSMLAVLNGNAKAFEEA